MYLATLLTVMHILFLIVSATVGVQWLDVTACSAEKVLHGQVWRLGTYILFHSSNAWFILEMLFLFIWGIELESSFGRRAFAWLYALTVLVPAVVAVVYTKLATPMVPLPLAGTNIVHFCPFLAIAFCRPDTPTILPLLKLKWLASAFFAVQCLGYIQDRYMIGLWAFLAACITTYIALRKFGLSPRFAGIADAIKPKWPQPKQKPKFKAIDGGKSSKKSPKQYYEPKIRPRAEIDREHPAVVEIDALLEKISRLGFGSLTEEEKKALDKASNELKDKDRRI